MAKCQSCSNQFEIRPQDREFYQKFGAPDPEMCPECRLQHRLCFRNERTFYKTKSAMSGRPMISIYSPDNRYKAISREEWWSDEHDALKYGRDFDFSRPFFEQFQELLLDVPRIGLFNVNPTNSDYCQQAYDNKNCYLCVVVEKCEDCMYVTHSNSLRDCFDCSMLHDCELCYECLDSNKLYACISCQSCQNSSDLIHCYDCIGCKNCVGCYGLRNKQYCIMNEQLTREEYEAKVKVLELNKYSKFLNCHRYFVDMSARQPHRSSRNLNTDDCRGDYLINCQRAYDCYDSFELQDCAYCTWIFNSHDCMDVYGMGHGEFVLEGLGVEAVNNCAWNTFVSDSSDAFYSDCCFYCMYIFGCAGLKSQKYCILNKQYKPEEYEELRGRIIEHMKKTASPRGERAGERGSGFASPSDAELTNQEWGRFFPVGLSPYSYNETAANYRFPLKKEEAVGLGYSWRDPDPQDYLPQTYELPDDVKETDAVVCSETLACIDCGKNYRVMPKELNYYKRLSVPISRKCMDCRFAARFALRNPRKLWDRNCEKCRAEIVTTFEPEGPEKIYCEKCYTEFVS